MKNKKRFTKTFYEQETSSPTENLTEIQIQIMQPGTLEHPTIIISRARARDRPWREIIYAGKKLRISKACPIGDTTYVREMNADTIYETNPTIEQILHLARIFLNYYIRFYQRKQFTQKKRWGFQKTTNTIRCLDVKKQSL